MYCALAPPSTIDSLLAQREKIRTQNAKLQAKEEKIVEKIAAIAKNNGKN